MDEVGDIVVRISNEDFTDVILVIGDTYGDGRWGEDFTDVMTLVIG